MVARRFLIGVAVALLGAAPALAIHNHLTKSIPEADQAVAAPKSIRLWFAEKVEPKFSSITLMRADSSKIEIPKAVATDDPKSIVADVPVALAPGKYLIRWRTAGDDGHAVRGTFAFTVK
ncbi:MAG: copper resistance protein CopC [Gemmatimonadales bacterium]